jgi:hypothetical protein
MGKGGAVRLLVSDMSGIFVVEGLFYLILFYQMWGCMLAEVAFILFTETVCVCVRERERELSCQS